MIDEKDEILKHIKDIQHHLVDKPNFFPYNYNATHIWSFIALILTLTMDILYDKSVAIGTTWIFILIAIGFIIEGIMIKKINQSYDIEDCTKKQHFIVKFFLMISIFLIITSGILASFKLYTLIYLNWLFFISLGYFLLGFILNISKFVRLGEVNMIMSILILSISFYDNSLIGVDGLYLIITKISVIVGLSISPSIVAWQQQKVS